MDVYHTRDHYFARNIHWIITNHTNQETEQLTYFGGNSLGGGDTSFVDTLEALTYVWFDISGFTTVGVSPMLLSSLSRPPSDELSNGTPSVVRFAGGLTLPRRGRSLPLI